MSMLSDLIKGLISVYFGDSVAEQFECTFREEEGFDEQNTSALRYILGCLNNEFGGVLTEEAIEELNEYKDRLTDYLY